MYRDERVINGVLVHVKEGKFEPYSAQELTKFVLMLDEKILDLKNRLVEFQNDRNTAA